MQKIVDTKALKSVKKLDGIYKHAEYHSIILLSSVNVLKFKKTRHGLRFNSTRVSYLIIYFLFFLNLSTCREIRYQPTQNPL